MVSSHFSEIEDKARSIFDDHNHSANSRIHALEVFRKTQGDRVRYAKEAGFLSRQPKHEEVTHKHASLDWSPEMRERGDAIGKWYSEKCSAKTIARPELQRLRADARAGRLQGHRLYLFRLDRLTRSDAPEAICVAQELSGSF